MATMTPLYMDQKKLFWYDGRDERAEFTANVFSDDIGEKVLDVGCWKKDLKNELPNDVEYIGIDIAGDPDIQIDLESDLLSEFESDSFDTIVCTEVLEHLDNIHSVFDELCRVASNNIIISLPNNYMLRDVKRAVFSGRTTGKKFYGLPHKIPNDRHKWFFNYTQAREFIQKRSKMNGASIDTLVKYPEDLNMTIDERLKRCIFRVLTHPLYGKDGYLNMTVSTLWVNIDV